ncbi:CoA-binding protein [Paludibacter sp.]
MKRTLIIGASSNPERYSYKAAEKLLKYGHEIKLVGLRPDNIFDHQIETEHVNFDDIDTVTLYVGPKNQSVYYDYIVSINPKRVIFNPGTENPELQNILKSKGISYEEACTLVLLGTNQY